jgi:hypothetical protein
MDTCSFSTSSTSSSAFLYYTVSSAAAIINIRMTASHNLPIITAVPDDIRELLEEYSGIARQDVIPHITAVVGVCAASNNGSSAVCCSGMCLVVI